MAARESENLFLARQRAAGLHRQLEDAQARGRGTCQITQGGAVRPTRAHQLASSPPPPCVRRCCTSAATTAKPATHAAVTSAVPSSSGDVLCGSAAHARHLSQRNRRGNDRRAKLETHRGRRRLREPARRAWRSWRRGLRPGGLQLHAAQGCATHAVRATQARGTRRSAPGVRSARRVVVVRGIRVGFGADDSRRRSQQRADPERGERAYRVSPAPQRRSCRQLRRSGGVRWRCGRAAVLSPRAATQQRAPRTRPPRARLLCGRSRPQRCANRLHAVRRATSE
jgi:hypothetical protein